jgi:TP901 family phage tail tape measure protein
MSNFATLVLGADTSGLIKGQKALAATTVASGRTERATDRTTASMGRMGSMAGGAATKGLKSLTMAATAAVGALVGIGAGVRVIREFETSVSRMGAISGATTVQLEQMRDVAKDLGSTTEFSAVQAADGLSFLSMAGFNAAESIAAIPAVLDLATASGMGLAQAADTASNIMGGFGLSAADAAVVTDVLAAASSRSNTSVSQLGAAMSTVAPIANTLNMSVAQTAAAIGVMSDAGIQGERAGTGLRGVLAALAGPTDQATEVFNRLGVSVGDLDPAANSLADIMATLGEKGLSTADAMTVFGREASSGALVLIEGAQRLGEFGDELDRVDGAAGDMAATMRDNLGGDVNGLISSLSGLMISLGEAGLTAILRGVINTVTDLTRGITAIVNAAAELGSFVGDLFSYSRGMDQVQRSADVANLAIADELTQVNALSVAMQGGVTMSRESADLALIRAKASLVAADAIRQENIEMAKSSTVYLRMAKDIEEAQLNLLDAQELARDLDSSGLEGLEYTAGLAARNIESMAAELRAVVVEQEEVIAAADVGSQAFNDATKAVADLEAAIALASGDVVVLGGEVQTAADTTDALARLAGGVSFDSATASAARLAAQLGISVALAARMNALGPQQAEGAGRGRGGDPRNIGGSFLDYSVRDADAFLASLNEIRVTAGGGGGGAAKSVSDLTRETKALADEIERLEFDADPLKSYNAEISNLDMLLDNGLSDGAYRKAVDDLNEGLLNSSPIVNSISDAFGTFLTQGVDGFDQFKNTIVDGFKRMLAEMIATAARNKIMISLGMAGSVAGSAASAGLGSIAMNGASASLSAFSGGLSAGIGQIGATMAGATSSLAGFAAAAGAIAVPLLAVTAAFSFFSTKTSTLDEGLRITTTNLNSMVESFDKVRTSRFWGLSTNIHTAFDEMGAAADPLRQTIGEIQTSIMDAAGVFGFGADAFAGFTHQFTLSLKDLDEAAQQAAIADELTKLGNAFTGMTGAFASTQELVTAAAQNYALTNRLLEAQGKSTELLTRQRTAEMDATHALNQPLLERINNLEDEAAATEAANAVATQNYDLTNRLLEAQGESTELLARQRNAEMNATHALNQPLLARIHLLEHEAAAADAASVEIERLADAAEAVAEAARAAIQGATDAALAPINDMLAASRSAASDARKSANEFFRLADSLREASGSIGGVTTAADLANEGQKFAQMFAAAASGDVDALGSLGSAGQSLASNSAGLATSAIELKRVEAGIRSQLDQGAAVAEAMGLGADYQALTFDLQTAALEVTRDMLESGDMTVDLMRQQVALLSNIGGLITSSANLQVQTGVNAAGQTVTALLDNSGRVVAGLSAQGSQSIAGMATQTGHFENAILGQTTSVNHVQGLTNSELQAVQGLQGETVGITRLVANATRSNETLSGQLLQSLNSDLNVAGIGSVNGELNKVTARLNSLINVQLLQNSMFENMTVRIDGAISFSGPITGNTSGMITFSDGVIPSFAGGVRNFAGGLAEIHDGAGGEIVNLPSGAQVIPHDLSRRMVDSSTAPNASTQSNDDSGVRRDLSELRRVMVEVVKYVKRTSDIERKHDIDGMPPVRT